MNSQAVTCTFRQAVERRTCTEHERVIAFTDVEARPDTNGAANAKRSSFLCEYRFLVLDLIEGATQRPHLEAALSALSASCHLIKFAR